MCVGASYAGRRVHAELETAVVVAQRSVIWPTMACKIVMPEPALDILIPDDHASGATDRNAEVSLPRNRSWPQLAIISQQVTGNSSLLLLQTMLNAIAAAIDQVN